MLKERRRESRAASRSEKVSSNLTNAKYLDVRAVIPDVAGVSTGNVTKVKQLLPHIVPAVREQLLLGHVSIHRAWQWRTLSPKEQRDALWEHLHRTDLKKTIARLIRAHVSLDPERPANDAASLLSALSKLNPSTVTVAVVDTPGDAVVVTQGCYDALREQLAG